MSRKRRELPLLERVEIQDVAAEGKAIVRYNEQVVFTEYAVPGDVVDLQITKKKHRYMEGRVVKFHSFSQKREEAKCPHFGVCGGCKWQILPYSEQLFHKQKQVEQTLKRIAKVELPQIQNIIGSEKIFFYRNKLEFTFSSRRWRTWDEVNSGAEVGDERALGFHIPGAFDKVLNIETCLLQDEINNRLRNFIRDYARRENLEFFDLKNQQGFLRTMILRTTSTGEVMLILSFFKEEKEKREKLLNYISENFKEITALLYVINPKANDTITDLEINVFRGAEAVYEQMEGLRFKIGAKSFYQTNSEQAYRLYSVVRQAANLTGSETVYDLYTGTGTIANFVARKAKKVVGIEYVPEAIEDAKENSQLNKIENTLFFAGDMKDILTDEFIALHGNPDVLITDPPRAGMHPDVVKTILNAAPKRIVYVSCNPATQARDLELLDEKYRVTLVQPVDMFPHTHHVENVVALELRG